jgi:hypothetical protein
MGKMEETSYLYSKGVLEVCTLIDDPTNKFRTLSPYIYGIVRIPDADIRIPARLTDHIQNSQFKPEDYEGREVVFRFRGIL